MDFHTRWLFIAHESLENIKIILLMSLSSGLVMHEHPVTYSFTGLQLTGNNTANVAKTVG